MEPSLDFDKHNVAQTSLRVLLHFLNSVKTDPLYWQWVYISLHSAVQGYMVLALTGTNSLLTFRDKDAKSWLKSYDANQNLPDCRLDSFLKLYSKTKSKRFLLYTDSQKFVPTKSQDKNIRNLNKFRNDFIHYKYDGFMMIQGPSPFQIVMDGLDFIDFLAFKSNNVTWWDDKQTKETKRILGECKFMAGQKT